MTKIKTEKLTTEIMTQINEELEKAYAKYEAGQGATYRSQKEVFLAGANSRDAEVERLKEENERLKNDLDDALDLKAGNGPTALSRVIEERDTLKKQVEDYRNDLIACKQMLSDMDYPKTVAAIQRTLDKYQPLT